MQNTQTFRALRADEVESSYELYRQVRAWLRENEIRLWLAPVPKQKFEERQARGELFGLFVGKELAVILAIVRKMPSYWQAEIGTEAEWWLETIATAPSFRGQQLGRLAISNALAKLSAENVRTVYLDCASGFLPNYYEQCGFLEITAKEVLFPSGNKYLLSLMKRPLTPNLGGVL